MIEDLKAMIDNISQEVALLKEKQALQTGKGLAAYQVATIAPHVLTRGAQAPHNKEFIMGREIGVSKKSGGSLKFSQADEAPQAVNDESRPVCGPLFMC